MCFPTASTRIIATCSTGARSSRPTRRRLRRSTGARRRRASGDAARRQRRPRPPRASPRQPHRNAAPRRYYGFAPTAPEFSVRHEARAPLPPRLRPDADPDLARRPRAARRAGGADAAGRLRPGPGRTAREVRDRARRCPARRRSPGPRTTSTAPPKTSMRPAVRLARADGRRRGRPRRSGGAGRIQPDGLCRRSRQCRAERQAAHLRRLGGHRARPAAEQELGSQQSENRRPAALEIARALRRAGISLSRPGR